MRTTFTTSAVLLAAISGVSAKTEAQLCQGSTSVTDNNYYCAKVNKIQYTGLTGSGSYQDVIGVSKLAGCSFGEKSYSGPGRQLAEQLSLHLRGPLVINQTAIYYPRGASKSKRASHVHGHQRFHQRRKEALEAEKREAEKREAEEKRGLGDWVTVTMDGQVVSWRNNWDGSKAVDPTDLPSAAQNAPQASATNVVAAAAAPKAASAAASKGTPLPTSTVTLEDGEWGRDAYYRQGAQPTGLAFLSYTGATVSSQDDDFILGTKLGHANFNGVLPSHEEVMIFSDKDCDSTCGYTRTGAVNKLGFGGARKVFAFQFSMADDGHRNYAGIGNWPAIWSLNAKIPRTQQYGSCSCWQSGCGELDLWETLAPGEQRCKSTYHGALGQGGGASNYFQRPVDTANPVTGVVVFYDDVVTLAYVDDFKFDEKLSSDTIKNIMAMDSGSNTEALFALAQ